MVKTPAGADTRMYVEADEGPRQIKVEAPLRRALRAAHRIQPALDWRPIKKDGVLTIGWQRVLRLRAIDGDNVVNDWNAAAVAALGVRKDTILAEIAAADSAGTTAYVEWCP